MVGSSFSEVEGRSFEIFQQETRRNSEIPIKQVKSNMNSNKWFKAMTEEVKFGIKNKTCKEVFRKNNTEKS